MINFCQISFLCFVLTLTYLSQNLFVVASSPSSPSTLTVRVRLQDGSVRRVLANPTDTIESVCDKLGCDFDAGVSLESSGEDSIETESTLKELNVKHGDWLYLLRDPEAGSGSNAASIQRMKKMRERAVKGGGVTEIKTPQALEAELKAAGRSLVVIDFYADWCGPCKQIAPKYKQMADEFTKAVFLKVNVDTNKATSQKYGVSSMPTFVLIKNGSVVETLKGANEDGLRSKISSLAT